MVVMYGLSRAAAGGLLPGDHGQHADGGLPSVRVGRTRQGHPAVEHQPRWPGEVPDQARAGPGGQRSEIYPFHQFGIPFIVFNVVQTACCDSSWYTFVVAIEDLSEKAIQTKLFII